MAWGAETAEHVTVRRVETGRAGPTVTHLQLADGLEPVHLILPQLHVFTQNLLALSDERNVCIILYSSS